MLLGNTEVSLPNGISFRQMALAWCTSVTDRHKDVHTQKDGQRAVTFVAIGRTAGAFGAAAFIVGVVFTVRCA